MKSRIPQILAALLVTAAPFAHSQLTAPAGLVAEPIATVSRQDDVANAVAAALNADVSLKHSKITVQPDEGKILLTGSVLTEAQRMQATKIATQHAGEGKVVNTIAHDENVVAVPVTPTASLDASIEPTPTASADQKQ